MGHRPPTPPLSTPADTHYPTSPPRRLKNPNQYLDIEYKAAGVQIRRPAADTLDESAELARQVSQDGRTQPSEQRHEYDPYPRVTVSEVGVPKGILKSQEPGGDERTGNKKPRPQVGWSENLSEDIGQSWWKKSRRRQYSGDVKEQKCAPSTKSSSTSRGEGSKEDNNPTTHTEPNNYSNSTKKAYKTTEQMANMGSRKEESQQKKETSGTPKYQGHKDDNRIAPEDRKTTPEPGVNGDMRVSEALRQRRMKHSTKSKPPHTDTQLREQRTKSWGQ